MLKLHGHLPKTSDNLDDGEFRPAIINGRHAGEKVTLYQSREVISGDDYSSFAASWMLIGKNFKSEAEIKPHKLSVGYTHLERWALDEPPFEVQWEPSEEGTKVMTYFPPEDIEIRMSRRGCKITLVHFDQPNPWAFEGRATWKHFCRFFIEPDTPQSLDWYAEMIHSLSRLLSCLVGRISIPTSLSYIPPHSGERTEEGSVQAQIEALFDGFSPPPDSAPPEGDRRPYVPLASLPEIERDITEVFESWFAHELELDMVHNLLLSVMDAPSVYAEYRCLALAQALESFHRRTMPGSYLEEKDFAKVKATLIEAIPNSISSDARNAFEGKLEYLNEFSLRKRLKQLMDRCGEATKQAITDSSTKSLVDRMVDTRNYLTHFTRPPSGGVPGAYDLTETAALMRRLLTAVVFQELGVNEDAVTKAVERIEPIPLHWYPVDNY
jgi:hypothetical protein